MKITIRDFKNIRQLHYFRNAIKQKLETGKENKLKTLFYNIVLMTSRLNLTTFRTLSLNFKVSIMFRESKSTRNYTFYEFARMGQKLPFFSIVLFFYLLSIWIPLPIFDIETYVKLFDLYRGINKGIYTLVIAYRAQKHILYTHYRLLWLRVSPISPTKAY